MLFDETCPSEKQLVQGTRARIRIPQRIQVDTHSSLGSGYLLSALHSSVFLMANSVMHRHSRASSTLADKISSVNPRPLLGGFGAGLSASPGACWWLHQVRFLESAAAGAPDLKSPIRCENVCETWNQEELKRVKWVRKWNCHVDSGS